jgi:hypothetical protein
VRAEREDDGAGRHRAAVRRLQAHRPAADDAQLGDPVAHQAHPGVQRGDQQRGVQGPAVDGVVAGDEQPAAHPRGE